MISKYSTVVVTEIRHPPTFYDPFKINLGRHLGTGRRLTMHSKRARFAALPSSDERPLIRSIAR